MQRTGTDRRALIWDILPVVLLVFFILLDQITKTCCKNLAENHEWSSTTVIEGFFYFYYTKNTGAAFSFLAGVSWGQTFFLILTAVALVLFFVFYVYISKNNYRWMRVSMVFVIAGTIGNFIDRLAYGFVVDFLSFIFGSYHFPVFNLADVFITIGVIMIVINYLFIDKDALFKFNHGNKKVSDSTK